MRRSSFALIAACALVGILNSRHTTRILRFVLLSSQQVHKSTTFISLEPTTILPAKLNKCFQEANAKYIRERDEELKSIGAPLFASIVATPARDEGNTQDTAAFPDASTFYWTAHFELNHITWKKQGTSRSRIAKFSFNDSDLHSETFWRCDGRPAKVVSKGCPGGSGISIQCPQQPSLGENITNITVFNHTYYVHDHVQCELNHPLRVPPALSASRSSETETTAGKPFVVGAVIMYKLNVYQVLEWLEYHRMIGVNHFYIYVMDPDLGETWWPDLHYVTYVPWDLNNHKVADKDKFIYQTAAQVDAIHRGRALGVDWIAFNDMDEFLVPRENYSLASYLLSQPATISAVQGETVTFGNQVGMTEPQKLQLHYTLRSVFTFGRQRCKCLVRPTQVDYYNIHWVTLATGEVHEADPFTELWVHHYKSARHGVFLFGLKNETVEDTSLRDKYAAIVESRADDIMTRKFKNATNLTEPVM